MAINFKDGKILFESSQVTFGSNCCCGDPECTGCADCCGTSSADVMEGVLVTTPLGGTPASNKTLDKPFSHSGGSTCEFMTPQITGSVYFVTQEDVDIYYAPNNIDVRAGDRLKSRVYCQNSETLGKIWYLQMVVTAGFQIDTVAFELVGTDTAPPASGIPDPATQGCPTPHGTETSPGTARTKYFINAAGPTIADRPRLSGGYVWYFSLTCTFNPPTACTFDPTTDCVSDGSSMPEVEYRYLKIDNWTQYTTYWSIGSCSGCETTSALPWEGLPIRRTTTPSECKWQRDTNDAASVGDTALTLGAVEIVPAVTGAYCGFFLEIYCKSGSDNKATLLWRGYREISNGDPRGTYTLLTVPAGPDNNVGCATLKTSLNVSSALAIYKKCSRATEEFDVNFPLQQFTVSHSCLNPRTDNRSFNTINTTGVNAKLWAISVFADDDITVDGVPVAGCGLNQWIKNVVITGDKANGATVRLQTLSYQTSRIGFSGTFQWRPTGDPSTKRYYRVAKYAKDANNECWVFVGWYSDVGGTTITLTDGTANCSPFNNKLSACQY